MKLNFRKIGEGEPFIILHGLYGMLDNWLTVGHRLSNHFEVYLIDQRNHGKSPHSKSFTYDDMVADLEDFFEENHIEQATIMGHSMGGKTAMFFATKNPERVNRLIIADIAPYSHTSQASQSPQYQIHKDIIEAMLSVNFEKVSQRQDVVSQLSKTIADQRIIHFLLKNLKKEEHKYFAWRLNVQALKNNLENVLKGLNPDDFDTGNSLTQFPVLFLKAENSDYIREQDYPAIHKIFPYADIVTIFDAGHWLHAEQTEAFLQSIMSFIFD